KKLAENVRHVSKYIFSRQYGLNTPFASAEMKGSSFGLSAYDYLDREDELKAAGPSKTPKRLKHVLPLIEKLLRRHCKCAYISMRDRACPSKVSSHIRVIRIEIIGVY
ncbi:hypothetical protein HYPSUDRAFT_133106, partial [Hypholoma sublateritium FD-334 SS-4]